MSVWLGQAMLDAMPTPGIAPAWLSAGERLRLATLTAPRRRAQFLAGHRLARELLAAAGGGIWSDWTIEADDGRPVVARGPIAAGEGWTLSLSHSGDLLACAVARGLEVGLDVETAGRARDLDRLLAFVCSDAERERFAALDAPAREQAFRVAWTLKEAWFKQRGDGLAPARLATLHTEPDAHRPQAWTWHSATAALAVVAPDSAAAPRWATLPSPQFAGSRQAWPPEPVAWRIDRLA